MIDQELDQKIIVLLEGMPAELREAVEAKVSSFKTKKSPFSNQEIFHEAGELVRLEMLAYTDPRKYLHMYNRRFAEHKIFSGIKKIVGSPGLADQDLYRLARVNFDLNGLKALNDLGGHEAGNRGLSLFASILQGGETTTFLRHNDIEVIPTAEGGDEFGMVLFGKTDLREHARKIVEGFSAETEESPAGSFINFSDPAVKENLSLLGIEVPSGFQFRLSTSVGISFLGEALAFVPVEKEGAEYDEIARELANKMFAIADKRAIANKSAYKEELDRINPILSALYARMSREVIHLQKEIRARDEKIKTLEGKLKTN